MRRFTSSQRQVKDSESHRSVGTISRFASGLLGVPWTSKLVMRSGGTRQASVGETFVSGWNGNG